ncbi:hypothetical protein D3C85_1846340 [compost metagenome]
MPTDTLGGVISMAVRMASVTVTSTMLLVILSWWAVASVIPVTIPVSRPVDETVAAAVPFSSQVTQEALLLISAVVLSL